MSIVRKRDNKNQSHPRLAINNTPKASVFLYLIWATGPAIKGFIDRHRFFNGNIARPLRWRTFLGVASIFYIYNNINRIILR